MPILSLLGLFLVEYYTVNSKIDIIKNALDLSNLSVYKDISKEELGNTGNIVFDQANLSNTYGTFKTYLQKNFNLDNELSAKNLDGFIEGKIKIVDFKIYNVVNGKVTQYDYNFSSNMFIKTIENASYNIYTSNGRLVDKTSVYSTIDVNMKMIFDYDDENNSKKVTIISYTDAVN